MESASRPSVKEITSQFCLLTLKSPKEQTLEWLRSNFPSSEERNILIQYLSRSEHIVEDKFYHKEKEGVIFYFQVYNRKTKRSCYKRISLRTTCRITSNHVKRGFTNDFNFHFISLT